MWWCIDRMRVTLSIALASRGRCSLMAMPSAFDETGLCEPRMPSGASGFMSNMSM